ncbi:uncharacterized protein LOC110023417 [Phalaenopsis equestris]|uniref:uncharacterized protein LOC110023417 n=1 Tax=Phalaenopsis equestris TaxID=78828 RepID=UPI0009E3EBF2|nr:uncharacterized protein LOC110023417 [Phalaenopsis equestris]
MLHFSVNRFLLLFLLLAAGSAASAADPPPSPPSNGSTVYELLPKYGLPPGLLPNTVTSFSLASNGEFEVNLAAECYVNFEYLVYYKPKITGVIRYGEIDDLKGIQVRRFFIWFDVDAIKVDLPPTNYIYFDVGLITKKLSVGQFKNVHSCQKGLSEDLLEHDVGLYQLSEDAGMIITE